MKKIGRSKGLEEEQENGGNEMKKEKRAGNGRKNSGRRKSDVGDGNTRVEERENRPIS